MGYMYSHAIVAMHRGFRPSGGGCGIGYCFKCVCCRRCFGRGYYQWAWGRHLHSSVLHKPLGIVVQCISLAGIIRAHALIQQHRTTHRSNGTPLPLWTYCHRAAEPYAVPHHCIYTFPYRIFHLSSLSDEVLGINVQRLTFLRSIFPNINL